MAVDALTLSFADHDALTREFSANLVHGRAFVAGARGYELFSSCELVLRHPASSDELRIPCQVVMVKMDGPLQGVALQFTDRSEPAQLALQQFVEWAADNDNCNSSPADEDCQGELPDDGPDHDDEADDGDSDAELARNPLKLSQDRQQRLRNLPPNERMRIAQGPVLDERVLLERIYGSSVWEHLLRNPRITVPEVARMARKGTMPRALLELITENEQWIRQSIVRRALLSNPRLSADAAARVLRSMSARELKLVPQQTAYPAIVRQTAQKLMRGG